MEKAKQKLNAKRPYRGPEDWEPDEGLHGVGCFIVMALFVMFWFFAIWSIWRAL